MCWSIFNDDFINPLHPGMMAVQTHNIGQDKIQWGWFNPDTKTHELLSEDQIKAAKLDNYQTSFEELADLSVAGKGCNQIKFIVQNAATLTEPVWRAGLSIAVNCNDHEQAIQVAGYRTAALRSAGSRCQ